MFSDILFDCLDINSEVASDITEKLENGITTDMYEIISDEDSIKYSKPKGKYVLMAIPDVLNFYREDIVYCSNKFADILSSMFGKIDRNDRILIVGLGNRHISSDSLGAKVVKDINITFDMKNFPKVMAICPSVMGLTGIETVDIVESVAKKTRATHVIIIDSLCASNIERLGKSIQVTNTGICPGGGIGNNRKCIDKSVASNVFSIGVPLLIYASTFVTNTLEKYNLSLEEIDNTMQDYKKAPNNDSVLKICKNIKNVFGDDVEGLIVSIKDIEECVTILAKIISSAINIALGIDSIN